MDPFPDNLTDEQKLKIMAEYKSRKDAALKEIERKKNEIPAWKIFAFLPLLFAVVWYLVPLPDAGRPSSSSSSFAISDLATATVAVPLRERAFDPSKYEQKVARCKATDLEVKKGWFGEKESVVETEIEIYYLDINPTAKKTLLLVHGWPAVWSSWRNQILGFENTHRLIIPSLRGFGNSTAPADTESSSSFVDFAGDMACVLEDAGVEGATCVGHDWGSVICFEAAIEHPEKITALANSAVPYLPAVGPFYTPAQVATQIKTLSYQAYLTRDRHLASRELDSNVADAINGLLLEADWSVNGPPSNPLGNPNTILGVWEGKPVADQALLSKAEAQYWIDAFKRTGFEQTIAIYQVKNRKRSHEAGSKRTSHAINVPTLFINPTADVLGDLRPMMGEMKKNIPNLTIRDLETNHWPQLEKPDEFNRYLREFLEGL